MTHHLELWTIIQATLRRDNWTSLEQIYKRVERSAHLDNEDNEPQSPSSDIPKWKRNVRNVLQYRKTKGEIEWDGDANYKL